MLAQRHLEHRRQMASSRAQRRQPTFSLSELQSAAAATKSGQEEDEEAEAAVDDWCCYQQALNNAIARILQHPKSGENQGENQEQEQHQQPPQRQIKVVQTIRNALSLNPLWQALVGCRNVSSLSLVGAQLDANDASLLGRALSQSHTTLQHLQLCRLLPTCIDALSQALPCNIHLTKLRLTFNHDVSPTLASTLLQAIAQHGSRRSNSQDDNNNMAATAAVKQRNGGKGIIGLTSLQLYGLDLSPVLADVALVVRSCQATLTDLRLTRCHLKRDLHLLTTAIYETNGLRVLDLSMNEIAFSCASDIAKLVQTPSIQELDLSQNDLGKVRTTATSSDDDHDHDARAFCQALGCNRTLTSLSLDMNPLSLEFANLLEESLAQNTTLTRLGILTSSLSPPPSNSTTGTTVSTNNDVRQRLRHAIQLNRAGRGWIRNSTTTSTKARQPDQHPQTQQQDDCCSKDDDVDPTKLFSHVLSRSSQRPDILYSLLQERPDFWIVPK